MKERKRKITIITIIGIMLILAVTTFTYAIWSRTHIQTGVNKNTYACFDISYAETNGTGITMENGYPQTDEQGMQNDPYEVQIKNTCDTVSTYNVILNKQEGSTLKDEHLKVAVDNDYKLLSQATPTDTREIDDFDNAQSYIIGEGIVLGNQTKTVQIRSWMDKDTSEQDGENKSFTFKITIEVVSGTNNYEVVKVLGKDYAARTEVPDFSDGYPNSANTSLSGLYKTQDDDGDSYYFRGKVEDNYVKLSQDSNILWRIVRVNGDGTIRLVSHKAINSAAFNLEYDNPKYVGYTYDNKQSCTNDNPCKSEYIGGQFKNSENIGVEANIKTKLENWYKSDLAKYDSKIALTTFCNDTSYGSGDESLKPGLYFGASERLKRKAPSLSCPNPTTKSGENRDYGGVYKLKIGLLTADEMLMAGMSMGSSLHEESIINNYLTYLGDKRYDDSWYTMSPSDFTDSVKIAAVSSGYYDGAIAADDVYYDYFVLRPVINLNSDVTVTGTGTQSDPYVVQ